MPATTRPKTVYCRRATACGASTMKNELRGAGRIVAVWPSTGCPRSCGVALNSGCRVRTKACCLSSSGSPPRRHVPALNHEPADDAMKGGAVVDAGRGQPQELPHVTGRAIGKELERDVAQRRLDHGATRLDSSSTVSVGERLRHGRRLLADRDRPDLDPRVRHGVLRRRGRDLLRHVDALGDAGEHGVLPVESWLIGDRDEELIAGAVAIVRHEHRGHRAARVLLGVGLEAQLAQAAGAVLRACAGSFDSGSPP